MNSMPVLFNKLRRVIHLADIHIRLYKRHDEYREAFATLYETLKKTDLTETLIVVAGDIVHSKTDLSPEMVNLASDFLKNLADLAPTVVIAGNHDMNMANANRMDALTPIINNISHDNLYYLKDSAVHQVSHDADLYVCSIIGDQADWPKPGTPKSDCLECAGSGVWYDPGGGRRSSCETCVDNGRTKIALFHGPVYNATTDVNFTITNRHVTVETFDGYDIVIMGDIHKHQVLQEAVPGKPIIVYSSSLIQQNHGEKLRGHGWCDWDIASRTFTFHELPNTYGYYTLELKNGKIPSWDDMPQNVYLRVFAGSMEQSEIKQLEATIRAKRNVREFSASNFQGARRSTGEVAGLLLDIFDVHVQNKLISDWLREAMPNLSEDALTRVFELNKIKNEEISAEDLARKITWKPLKLQFNNLFTYGEHNSINFATLHGVNGIFAPNASGKTSIAEAICFALYDRTPRTQKAVNIMNTRATKCWLEFTFELEGRTYVIERIGTKNKKGEVKMDVNFVRLTDDGPVSLNGSERRYTNEAIRQYVGDFEDFLLTTFSSSSQTGLFVDKGQSDRKDLLSQFMGLNIFDKLQSKAADESKEIQGALKRFKNDDFTQELVNIQEQIKQAQFDRMTAEQQLESVQDSVNELTERMQRLYEKKTPVRITTTLSQLELIRTKLITEKKTATERLTTTRLEHDKLTAKMAIAKSRLENEYATVGLDFETYQKTLQSKKDVERNIRQYKMLVEGTKDELNRDLKFKYDSECDFCVTNGKEIIERIADKKELLGEYSSRLDRYVAEDRELSGKLASFEDIEEKHKKLLAGKNWIAVAENDLSRFERTMLMDDFNLQTIDTKIIDAEKDIADYHNLLGTIEENERIDLEIQQYNAQKNTVSTMVKQYSSALMQAGAKIQVSEQKKKDMLNRIKEAQELESKYEAYEAYLAAIGRDGLPYKLIAEVLPSLETAVNQLLSQMVPFTLLFETDGKNINMKIRYEEERQWPLEMASGMEKFISSLAIRVALTSLSSLPKSNFLIIDEGLGSLDQDNLASIFMLFDVLRTQFDFILLISHVDEVRDIADHLLEIKRENGYSKIQH